MKSTSADRRDFLKTTAAAGAVLGLAAKSYGRVAGSNDKIGIAFLGVGGRCQQHIDPILKMVKEGKGVQPVAVCDVWDGDAKLGGGKGKGLFPSAQRCGINVDDKAHVSKDYRKILELKEVDAVCVATPDHWHAKMAIDAMNAGKDVYCEKPMVQHIDDARRLGVPQRPLGMARAGLDRIGNVKLSLDSGERSGQLVAQNAQSAKTAELKKLGFDETSPAVNMRKELGDRVKAEPEIASKLLQSWIHSSEAHS
jgi:hypothetical protein